MRILICTLLALSMSISAYAQNFDAVITTPHKTTVPQPTTQDTSPVTKDAQASACVDDPRLADIGTIMANPSALTTPLTLTAETYLLLDVEVTKPFIGKIRICPDNFILPSGKPMKKISIKFSVIMDKILQLAMNGDFEEIAKLAQIYTAAPLSPQELEPLFAMISLGPKTTASIYNAFRMSATWPHYIDIFLALGGKMTQEGDIYFSLGEASAAQLKKLPKNAHLIRVQLGYYVGDGRDNHRARVAAILRKLGLNPIAI